MRYISYTLIFTLIVVVIFFVFKVAVNHRELVDYFDIKTSSNIEEDKQPSNTEPLLQNYPEIRQRTQSDDLKITITDGVRHIVPLNKIRSGGPPKDGIPSIDDPKFISVQKASEFLEDNKLGIAVEKDGDWRFYPFQILVWHEIVNDVFKGENILVTYCPLCQTGIVFVPEVEGEFVEFGTSGRLYNSNLVMYDRKTDSLWSQQGGRAIVGKLAGERLKIRSADNIFWSEFRKAHPEAEVLSRKTGVSRDYSSDPYGEYYTTKGTLFPLENEDDRLFDKAITYGLEVNGETKAYAEEAIKRDGLINDVFADLNLVVVVEPITQAVRFYNSSIYHPISSSLDGRLVVEFELRDDELFDTATGSKWSFDGEALSGPLVGERLERINPEFGFWFAWVAFNPKTHLYK